MLFNFILELPFEIGDESLEIGYFSFFDVELFLDFYLFSVEAIVFLGLLARKLIQGLLMGFPFRL